MPVSFQFDKTQLTSPCCLLRVPRMRPECGRVAQIASGPAQHCCLVELAGILAVHMRHEPNSVPRNGVEIRGVQHERVRVVGVLPYDVGKHLRPRLVHWRPAVEAAHQLTHRVEPEPRARLGDHYGVRHGLRMAVRARQVLLDTFEPTDQYVGSASKLRNRSDRA